MNRANRITLAVLGIGALVLLTRQKHKPSLGWQRAPEPRDAIYVKVPNGWRRATDSELTSGMRATAQSVLRSPLGSLLGPFHGADGGQYMIAIETHSNAPKGASVLLPA